MCVVLAALPWVLPSSFLLRTLIFIGLYSLVAMGLSMLMSYTGQVSIGHAGFMAIGAYTSAILTTKLHLPPLAAVPLAVAVTVAISYPLAVTCLRLTGHYLAMVTLGLGLMINTLIVELSSLTGGVRGIPGVPNFSIFGIGFTSDWSVFYLIWALVMFVGWMCCNLVNSRVGRALKAIEGDEPAAASFGIDVKRYKIAIFLFSTALAALAGSLMAHYMTFVGPEPFSLYASIMLLMMALLGGSASPLGAIIGAVIVGGFPQVLTKYQYLSGGIFGAVLLLTMLFLPDGVLGLARWKGILFKRRGGGQSAP